MCGISGIISKKKDSVFLQNTIKAMTNTLIHRGPDSHGYYYDECSGLAFGHRRLSILDLSPAGHQPMKYSDRYVITYNGEVYNYLELKKELNDFGYTFNNLTDTEVILAAYDKWGAQCLDKFNGMFAFAIYDKQDQIVFIARDRFGVKPLYYFNTPESFHFASEIKAFTCLNEWRPTINLPAALIFLKYSIFDHSKETLFSSVNQMRGGECGIFNIKDHSLNIKKWYDLSRVQQQPSVKLDDAITQFKSLFYDSIRLRLRSDVKIGSCLSGGLDSSSVVCVVNDLLRDKNSHELQETISSCFFIKKYDEQQFIDEVIKKTKVNCHKIYPDFKELVSILDTITWHQDEPFGSTSIFAQWCVFKSARQNTITVMLDGQGGDEVLAGYHTFYQPFFSHLLRKLKLITLYKELRAYHGMHNYLFMPIILDMLKPFIPLFLKSSIKDMINNEKIKYPWLSHDFPIGENLFTKIIQKKSTVYDKSIEQITLASLPMLLHYEDRNSMAHAVEARVPFLDYRFVEFILSLPEEIKINKAKTKFILRESFKDILPSSILSRYDKMGFVTPEEVWLRDNSSWVYKKLNDAVLNTKGFITKSIIKKYENFLNGKETFDSCLWRIISFSRWLKVFNVTI